LGAARTYSSRPPFLKYENFPTGIRLCPQNTCEETRIPGYPHYHNHAHTPPRTGLRSPAAEILDQD